MQVAVAGMTEGTHHEVVLLGDLVELGEHGRDLGARHGGVFEHAGGTGAGKGGQSHAASGPELVLFFGGAGNVNGGSAALLEHFFHAGGVVGDLSGVTVHFDEQHGGGVNGQAALLVGFDHLQGVLVEQFEGAGQNVGGDDTGHGVTGILHVGEFGGESLGGLGRRNELEDSLADDAHAAFGGHHEAGEVEAGDALHGTGAGLHQVALVVIELEAHDVVLGDAVLQAAQTASVLGDVAGDGGNGHGAGIRRIEEALGFHGGGELGGDDTRFDHGIEIFGVDLKDAVQGVGEDDDAVFNVRHSAAGKVGTSTADGDGQTGFVAEADDVAELLGLGGTDNEAGSLGGQHGTVIGIAGAVGFRSEDVFGAKQGFQVFD